MRIRIAIANEHGSTPPMAALPRTAAPTAVASDPDVVASKLPW
jgi:hypothetical protein